jgi:Na+-transporting NADH:ubiquinone oxidoreductase subunit NqrB
MTFLAFYATASASVLFGFWLRGLFIDRPSKVLVVTDPSYAEQVQAAREGRN